jgi:AcrR family transcriptional regulator
MMVAASLSKERQEVLEETEVRARILDAAFAAFMKSGYAATSTLEIATRARVSKRELYALVGNKHARRRRATEITRSRVTCPRRHSRVSATSSATE